MNSCELPSQLPSDSIAPRLAATAMHAFVGWLLASLPPPHGPSSPPPHGPATVRYEAGIVAARAGDAAGAASALEEAGRLAPRWPLPLLKLGNVQAHLQGDAVAAEASYLRSIQLEPTHDGYYFLGKLQAASGCDAAAADSYESALCCDPTSPASRVELHRACVAAGLSPEESDLRLLRTCCRADPGDVRYAGYPNRNQAWTPSDRPELREA